MEASQHPAEPVPLRIVAPIHQLFYQPGPIAAEPLGTGRWRLSVQLSESNVLHPPGDPVPKSYEVELDLEMTRLALGVEFGCSERWTVGAELPLVSFHRGFLDSVIGEVEEAIGKVKPRRREEIPDQFVFQAARDGEVFLDVTPGGLHPGDLALTARRRLFARRGRRPELALRAGLKLPTGDRERATGSGELDVMLGVAVAWRLGRWQVASGLALTVPTGGVANTPALVTVPSASGYADLGYPLGRGLAAHVQVAGTTQPFRLDEEPARGLEKGMTRSFDGHVLQVAPALSWRLDSSHRLYVGLVEDFGKSEAAASDLTVFVALTLWPTGWSR